MVKELPFEMTHDKKPHAGCMRWYWASCKDRPDVKFKRACGNCKECRLYFHNGIVGPALAEAESSAFTLSLTLTYADVINDHGEKVPPDGAKRACNEDVSKFVRAIRRQGYRFSKIAVSEYGSENGRAHWHLILFFSWSRDLAAGWFSDFVNNESEGRLERRQRWAEFGPPLWVESRDGEARPGKRTEGEKERFRQRLNDPDLLVCSEGAQGRGAARWRNVWGFWPHGKVEAQLLRHPGILIGERVIKGVSYAVKYATKDPWKDSKKWRHTPFDELPEYVKQATAYGPWLEGASIHSSDAKWHRRNEYAKQLQQDLLSRYASDSDVPIDERMFKTVLLRKKQPGGLGNAYFRAYGVWMARQHGEPYIKRTYTIPGVYPRANERKRAEAFMRGFPASEQGGKLIRFYMGRASFRVYGSAFNAELSRQGKEETLGKDFVFDNLDTERSRSMYAAQGSFGWAVWNKSTVKQRDLWAEQWSYMPDSSLRGLLPPHLWALLENHEERWGWPEKRRKRMLRNRFGLVVRKVQISPLARLEQTNLGKVFYYRLLKEGDGKEWWSREVKTEFELKRALAETLLPPDARSMRLEKEFEAKPKFLAALDPRTVIARIERATGRDFGAVSAEWLHPDAKPDALLEFTRDDFGGR